MTSRISGIGLSGLQHKVRELHNRAFDNEVPPVGGVYRYRRKGENHGFDGTQMHTLQNAVATDSTLQEIRRGCAALRAYQLARSNGVRSQKRRRADRGG